MSDETPRAALPLLAAAQAQKHVTHNEALLQLDALNSARFLDRDLSAPPSTPADGDAYLVQAPGSGAWSGQDGRIAFAVDGGWRFYPPYTGLVSYVADEAKLIVFTGGAWADYASTLALQNVPLLGVNAAADSANKFSVASAGVLFNHVGNGVQAKLNKNASTDSASLLYQTGFSGRAEIGLTGDDDFHFKTSPDGSAWRDALTLKSSGRVGIGTTQPAAPLELHVDGSVTSSALIGISDFVITKESAAAAFSGIVASDANRRMIFSGARARGSLSSPTAVASDDWTFSLLGTGYDGTAARGTAGISFLVDGAVSSGNVPQRIVFETGSTSTRIERVRINATGEMGVGKIATAGVLLDVNGPVGLRGYTVAALPNAAQPGQIVYVSNESGGAVPAFSDGTNWRRVTDRVVVS